MLFKWLINKTKEKEMERITLGDKVRDTVTGWEGIAVCRHTYLQGCDRISVQPKKKKDGDLLESISFDEPQLEIVERKKIIPKVTPNNTGGPAKYADTPR